MKDHETRPTYFDASRIGGAFERLAVDVVRCDTTEIVSRWFRSRVQEADLAVWSDGDDRIIKYQFCFFGQIVEWNPIQGTRTGWVVEVESNEGSEIIEFDQQAAGPAVAQAIQILIKIPQLSETDRETMIFNLRESPKFHKQARERALKAWAPKLEELLQPQRPSFWKRIRRTLFR